MGCKRLFIVRTSADGIEPYLKQFEIQAGSLDDAWELAIRRWRRCGVPDSWHLEDTKPFG